MALRKLTRHETATVSNRPVKVIQFGEGNFLRAFVDWMIEQMNTRGVFQGDVMIVQPLAQGLGPLLNKQEGLYHVVLQGIQHGETIRQSHLITCVQGVVNPYEQFTEYLALAENPDLDIIISNTTEAGIVFDPTDVRVDQVSNAFPGKLTSLLYHRYQHFKGRPDKALTILPCELIEQNGNALRHAILQYAAHWQLPEGFRTWITTDTIFCNTLVDRIVPGFPKDTIGEVQQSLGYEDSLVVTAEPFHLWVIEGPDAVRERLPANRADLEVKFVRDQTPYRTRKVRILNGAHTALVPVAYLRGIRTVREAVEDTYTGEFIQQVIDQEIIPTLDLPAQELQQFASDVLERFRNPFIRHELLSIALNSVSKFKVRVLPSILLYQQRTGQLPPRLMESLAALLMFYTGNFGGQTIPLQDSPEVLTLMKEAWQQQDAEAAIRQILGHESLWGQDLTQVNGLVETVVGKFNALAHQSKG